MTTDTLHPAHSPVAAIAEARRVATTLGVELREACSLSLADIGTAVGVSPQAVWLWERGEARPSGQRAVRYLGVLEELAAQSDPFAPERKN